MSDGFDRSDEGQSVAALLRRHAPPRPDARAAASRVLSRVQRPVRETRLLRLLPFGLAAAAAAVAAVVYFAPPTQPPPSSPAPSPAALAPAEKVELAAELVVGVRSVGEGLLVLDAGLTRGLRVGDILAAGASRVRVTAVGIFHARALVEGGPALRRGDRLAAEADTEPMKRARRFELVGGDPGALFEFGAVVEPLSPVEARQYGVADGRALMVIETFSSLLRGESVEPTLAGRAGLKPGDVILSCNGVGASSLGDFTQALELTRRSGLLRLRVLRGMGEVELQVR
ncbi:PDZ domain-containing protein [bacterium]|nr:MAG: PDZ domain-containing protein [bacterium]RIK61559.1 MAG: hypothetical protein DCC64_13245 [Planctomycetota bacterium]